MKKTIFLTILFLVVGVAICGATTSASMPWDTTLQKVVNALSGNTAKLIGIGATVLIGGAFLFANGGMDKTRVLMVILGMSIMFNAPWIVATLFGGGALQ